MQYEQVDKLIEDLAENISQKVESERCEYAGEIEGKTNALANLVSARASLSS